MDREEMIDYLIDSDFRYIMECANGPELLDSYLGFGFKGYQNFTDDELRYEVAQRKEIENA
jgi:hypothetical protein